MRFVTDQGGLASKPLMTVGCAPAVSVSTREDVELAPVGGKAREPGDTCRKPYEPLPLRRTACDPLSALSVTVRVPFCRAAMVGVNETLIAQLAPTASVAGALGQVSTALKSPPPVIE